MSREEAIKILNDYDINFERNTAEEVAEAHEMSIEALEAQPSEDCISRDATLTAFSDYVGGGMSMNDFDAMWDIVVKMPPVEPKPKTSEDCISRKDIDLTNLEILMCNGDYKEALKMLLDKIEKAPSVAPQPKTGHWIEHKHGGIEHIECSKCKCWFLRKDLIRNSYCPNCGSRNHWEWELKMQEVKK